MTDDVFFYGYAEDILSCAIMQRLFIYRNESVKNKRKFCFHQGFPVNKRGCSNLKKMIPKLVKMTNTVGLHAFVLTDLDQRECAPSLIAEWFPMEKPVQMIFRVAEREVESWLIADSENLGMYLEIAAENFGLAPEELQDPKQYLLNVIQRKGRKKYHKQMLPQGNAHIGPEYNLKLCDFVNNYWNPMVAQKRSKSLRRAIRALVEIG